MLAPFTGYYKASVSFDQDQLKFYEKIFSADMIKVIMSALINEHGRINQKGFNWDQTTNIHTNVPELVQRVLNKFL